MATLNQADRAHLALMTEKLLLDPQAAAYVLARVPIPLNLLDQKVAATRHATRHMRNLAKARGGTLLAPRPDQVPGWQLLGAITALVDFAAEAVQTCLHDPSPRRPEPIVAAAWRPGLVTCTRCVRLLDPTPGSVEDRTCDGCGHECAGPDVGDPIYPVRLQFADLIFLSGACPGCRSDLRWPAM